MLNALALNGPTLPAGTQDFEAALVAALKSSPFVQAVVGAAVFPTIVPEDDETEGPKLTYRILSNPRDHHLDGSAGIARSRVQFTANSTNKMDCWNLREALRQQFDGFKGLLNNAVRVNFAALVNETDSYEEPVDDSDVGSYMKVLEFKFTYKESLPSL